MSTLEIIWRMGAGVLLILANAFFVAIEFALTRLRQHSEEEVEGHPGRERGWEMTERLEIYLTGCQVGISLTTIVLGVVTEPAMTYALEPLFGFFGFDASTQHTIALVVGIVILNLVHKIWGEQTPTYLGVERPLEVTRWAAPIHYWWTKLAYPFIILGDSLAKWSLKLFGVEMTRSWAEEEEGGGMPEISGRAELREAMIDLLGRGELDEERRQEVVSALEIGDTPVRDIMIPHDEVVYLSTQDSARDNIEVIKQSALVRYPLVGASPEEFVGIVYGPGVFKHYDELLEGELSFADISSKPLCVPADTTVDELVDILQEKCEEAALIEDADGTIVGFVTATDAFEAVVGNLEDPFD